MADIAERAFNSLFPSADELWERGGADVTDGVPHFTQLEIDGDPEVFDTRAVYKKDRFRRTRIGTAVLLGYTMSDGIDRLVSVKIPEDRYRSPADMLVTTSTAWTTTVGGYVQRRDERIVRDLGVPTAAIGAEGSTNVRMLDAEQTGTVSLAKAAQSEQAILADLSERFDLPTAHYAIGDSRGAMIKPAHSLYAPSYGNDVLFTDIKAPCVPDKMTVEDLPKVALWGAVEVLGFTAVSASLARERDLGLLLGTFDPNPKSMVTAVKGVMPALMSGEAGRLAEAVPDDMRGHVVLYGHDILSSVDRWHEIYAPKYDVTLKNVPRGSHAHLLGRLGLQIDRIGRAAESLQTDGAIDTNYVVRGHKPDYEKRADLRLIAN